MPEASSGKTSRTRSTLSPNGELLSWAAGTDDTLQLRLFATESGTYSISLSAVHGHDGPVMSVKLWDDPLTRNGEKEIVFSRAAGPEILAVRFDRVSLGPGHHILEMSCLEPGQLLLDCVTLRRTGERIISRRRAQARDEGRAFLGIRMGGAESGGVAISDTVAGTAAAAAGIEAGDVLVRIDDEPMDTANRISEAILRHRPGDRVKLALLRDGELVERVVTLGRRSESKWIPPDHSPYKRCSGFVELSGGLPAGVQLRPRFPYHRALSKRKSRTWLTCEWETGPTVSESG